MQSNTAIDADWDRERPSKRDANREDCSLTNICDCSRGLLYGNDLIEVLSVLQVKDQKALQEPVDVTFCVFNADIGRMKRCIKYNVTVTAHEL